MSTALEYLKLSQLCLNYASTELTENFNRSPTKLREGNIFTSACLFTAGRVGMSRWWVCPEVVMSGGGRGLYQGADIDLLEGVGIPEGMGWGYTGGQVYQRGYTPTHPGHETPLQYWHLVTATTMCMVGKRAVSIILECFLVWNSFYN